MVSEEAAASAITDDDNPFAELEEDEEEPVKTLAANLNLLRTNYSDQVNTDFAVDEYIDFDRELSTKQNILTDKDIIYKVLGNSVDVSSDDDDMEMSEVESIRKSLIEEVRRAIEMLEISPLFGI